MPKITAAHRIITDECRKNRGDSPAMSEAQDSIWKAYDELVDAWPIGKGAKIHIDLSVEYDK